jgi:hypothetical protein
MVSGSAEDKRRIASISILNSLDSPGLQRPDHYRMLSIPIQAVGMRCHKKTILMTFFSSRDRILTSCCGIIIFRVVRFFPINTDLYVLNGGDRIE